MCACAMVSGDGTQRFFRHLRLAHQVLLLAEPFPWSSFPLLCQGESFRVTLDRKWAEGTGRCCSELCLHRMRIQELRLWVYQENLLRSVSFRGSLMISKSYIFTCGNVVVVVGLKHTHKHTSHLLIFLFKKLCVWSMAQCQSNPSMALGLIHSKRGWEDGRSFVKRKSKASPNLS